MKKYPIIYIEWCDAISFDGTWLTKEDAIKWASEKNWITKEIGYLIEENDKYILIASRLSIYTDEPQFGGLFKIPKTWILKRINNVEMKL